MDFKQWAYDNRIVWMLAGSHLYGTSTPQSDKDYRGVCIVPPEVLLGFRHRFEQYCVANDTEDVTIYGLNKFVALAAQCNPNILDLLFAPPGHWLEVSKEWKYIYWKRHLFLSDRVRHTFGGYAHSQLHRIKQHYRWTSNPPEQPTPKQFGGYLRTYKSGAQRLVFHRKYNEEKYQRALKEWKDYNTWLTNRNPARHALEVAHGYDTKHAMHLVRLLIKGKSILETGDYNPELVGTELDFALGVRTGRYSYEWLLDYSEERMTQLKDMPTDLPRSGKHDKQLDDLVIGINREALEEYYD